MNRSLWILDEDDDNRSLAIETLAHAGMSAIGFGSTEGLLSYAARRDPPAGAVIDARSAEGSERAIHDAIRWRLVVLTTWPTQVVPWMTLGVSRFLLKPYDLPALLEHFDGADLRPPGRSGVVKVLPFSRAPLRRAE